MVTPTSMGDWAQAVGMGGLVLVATWWFVRALREESIGWTGAEASESRSGQ